MARFGRFADIDGFGNGDAGALNRTALLQGNEADQIARAGIDAFTAPGTGVGYGNAAVADADGSYNFV